MLNELRPVIGRVVNPIGEALARTPVTPTGLTVLGTAGFCVSALSLMPTGHLFAGTLVCTFFVLADLFDGALARAKGSSGPWGAFIDSTMDRVADAALFLALAFWFAGGGHNNTLAVLALVSLVAGALVSYALARAKSLGLRCDAVGLIERPERMLIGLVATGLAGLGVPYALHVGLWILAVGSVVTFGQRLIAIRRDGMRGEHAGPGPAPDPERIPDRDGGTA
ncbi:MAG TPA: CDP-alcohol phosphatidyltransferase family protein [Streptosporangiaceae bacterium]|jgi:CDP-diacylglycerol--glycerol-3-phosphate 3-phosphatidyltransferase